MRWLLPALLVSRALSAAPEDLLADDLAIRAEAAASLGAKGIPLLVDALEDDAAAVRAAVRAAAAKRLAELGRPALKDFARYLADRDDPSMAPLVKMGETFLALGAAVTSAEFADAMGSRYPPSVRRAGAASAAAAGTLPNGPATMLDVLAGGLADPDESVRAMCSTWPCSAGTQPAGRRRKPRSRRSSRSSTPRWTRGAGGSRRASSACSARATTGRRRS